MKWGTIKNITEKNGWGDWTRTVSSSPINNDFRIWTCYICSEKIQDFKPLKEFMQARNDDLIARIVDHYYGHEEFVMWILADVA